MRSLNQCIVVSFLLAGSIAGYATEFPKRQMARHGEQPSFDGSDHRTERQPRLWKRYLLRHKT